MLTSSILVRFCNWLSIWMSKFTKVEPKKQHKCTSRHHRLISPIPLKLIDCDVKYLCYKYRCDCAISLNLLLYSITEAQDFFLRITPFDPTLSTFVQMHNKYPEPLSALFTTISQGRHNCNCHEMCMCVWVCVSSGSWLCSCVHRIFGSPVVWVTWRFGPSQLSQMVRAQQLSARGERGGSVVITSWLSGSAGAVSKTSAATGTRGCACRLEGGPWSLRGQVFRSVCTSVHVCCF